jgi:hypothetical protein
VHPNVTFGGGLSESFMSPVVAALMLVTMALVFLLPRNRVAIPFLVFTFLTPLSQQVFVGGVHLFAQRLVTVCGLVRYLLGSKRLTGGFNRLDKLFLLWAVCRAGAFVLLFHEGGAVVNQAGFLIDAIGGYLFVRYLIRDESDIRLVARVLVVIAFVMAACMLYEHVAKANVFSLLFGGQIAPHVRNGKIRSHGVFLQEILASAFGGTLPPLFLWLCRGGRSKIGALVGVVSSAVITVTSSSSTGVSAFIVGVVALLLWPLRKHMRPIRWGIVAAIAGLAMVMKAPVWYIIARVDFAGGSTGWDRAFLIDQFIRHFSDWWLIGTHDNASWGDFTWDQCNQFVAEGETGGLVTLTLFIMIISWSFSKIGIARKVAGACGTKGREWLLWTMGATLCAHIAAFMGISYFDQTKVWWFVTLAIISVVTVGEERSHVTPGTAVADDELGVQTPAGAFTGYFPLARDV